MVSAAPTKRQLLRCGPEDASLAGHGPAILSLAVPGSPLARRWPAEPPQVEQGIGYRAAITGVAPSRDLSSGVEAQQECVCRLSVAKATVIKGRRLPHSARLSRLAR